MTAQGQVSGRRLPEREPDSREGWIRLHKVLDRLDKHLDEEYSVLEIGEMRRLEQLRKKGKRLFEEACQQKRMCNDIRLPEAEIRAFAETLKQKTRRIRIKILRNAQRAKGIRLEAQASIKSLRVKSKVINGYFRQGPSVKGYFIDRQIGAHYK